MIIGRTSRVPSVPRAIIERMGDSLNIDIKSVPEHICEGHIPEWITTRHAGAHVDDGYTEQLFLTLSLRDGFDFGGEWQRSQFKYDTRDRGVPRGTWFLVDPAQLHWMEPHGFGWESYNLPRWWGLQWQFEYGPKTPDVIYAIMRAYDSIWEADNDQLEAFYREKLRQVRYDRRNAAV